MTEITSEFHSRLRSVRRFGLTEGEIFRLWKAAIMDDDKLVDEVIQKVYLDMTSFDRQRAEDVMALVVRRNREALLTLRSLFEDMCKSNDRPKLSLPNVARQEP
jgi:hypothetical protein